VVGLARIPSSCSFSTRQCAAPPGDPAFGVASSAVHMSNIGWLTAAIGVTALTGGLVWYLTAEDSKREHNVVAPWATPEAAGVAAIGRF
jgi:hypothetical protein